MDKAKVLEFTDALRNDLLKETKKRAAHYGILPNKISEVEKGV